MFKPFSTNQNFHFNQNFIDQEVVCGKRAKKFGQAPTPPFRVERKLFFCEVFPYKFSNLCKGVFCVDVDSKYLDRYDSEIDDRKYFWWK